VLRPARRSLSRLVHACWSQAHQIVAATVLVALFALATPPVAGATNVSGTISTNTTWTLANSPYVMTGNVTVAAGVTLTIEPGVVIQGNSNLRSLTVNGSLSAVGTLVNPITFTSVLDSAPAQWLGITFPSGSGTSTLKYVNVRYGGGGAGNDASAQVTVNGGTITIEDSTISSSSVSGLAMNGGTSGTAATLTVRRTKFENNGFYANSNGDGLYSTNARFVIEDSAFWSNKSDGLVAGVTSAYTPTPSEISGSSFWKNGRYGVYIDQGSGAAALGPDGNISGKLGNVLYDNGTFGLTSTETWQQLKLTRDGAPSVDWSNGYWGPVVFVSCGLGSQMGHLSYAMPDANPTTPYPVERGPVSYTTATDLTDPNNPIWCGNDSALDYPVANEMPAVYFPPPVPPTMGGIQFEQTLGSTDECDPQVARTICADPQRTPLAHTPYPVNTASGTLVETATDLRLAGPGIPFDWTRTYNSRDTTSGALGPGWSHPYWATVTIANPPTGDLLDYRAGSGQRTRFKRITGGSGAATFAAKGFDGTLKRLTGGTYELKTRDQRTFTFNTDGKLTQMKPRFGPATTLAYDGNGKLSSITDSAGRTITISYLVSDPTLIEKVTLPDGRFVQYGYTSGKLTSVRDPRGKTWTIAYDGNGRLTSIQDPVGHYELQNVVYDGSGRVTSEQNGTGDAIAYAYTTASGYDVNTVTIPGRGDWVYKHAGYLLFQVKNPLNKTTYFTYDGGARKATVKDARGYLRRFEYDKSGNVKKEIAPQSLGTIVRTFNATNDPLTVKDGRLNTTTYAYATGSDPAADYQVGQLKSITDREGGLTTFKYWTMTSTPTPPATNIGLLKSVTNQRSKTTSYEYDSYGSLTKVTSPLGLKTTMTYESLSGRLLTRRDPRGNVPDPPAGYLTQWAYDDVDHVTSLTDARGKVTSFDYYDNELLWKVTRNDGTPRVTTLEYDNANRLWKTTDPRSGVETRLYWPDGRLKSVQSPEGRKTSYDYDAAGQLQTLVEPNGNATGGTPSDWTWTYGYDDAGNRTSEAHPDGGTRTISYDALNRPFEWRDALTHLTSVEYDENDNVKKRTNALGKFRTYTYDKLDRLLTEKDERQLAQAWTYEYWPTGELKSLTTPLGNKTSYALDDDGRRLSMVEPRGNVQGADPEQYKWLYQYDEAGNRTRVTDPLGNYVQYGYDAVNSVSQATDQRGNATALAYDDLNRLWKVTPPAAGGTGTLDTVYGYDAAGNLTSRTDPNAHVTSWSYDLDGRLTQRTTPVGSWNYGYDANGNLKTLETPAGSSTPTPTTDGTITYGYDRMSRRTSVDYSDTTPDVTRSYDLAGRPATMTDGSGTVTYTFDDADRLTDIARTGGGSGLNGSFHYGYDDAGNITGRTYPDSTATTETFDDDGRLISVSSGGQTTSFGYDAAGNVTTETLPNGNGHVATRTFDRAGRLTTVENAKAGTVLSKFLWTLDAAGNPTKVQTTRGVSDTYDAYEYDARNRLTASCFGVSSGASDCTGAANKITYAYDKVSNRTQEVRTGSVGNTGTIDYAYNAADQLTSTTKSGQSTTYTYDGNGNQASIGARTFTYDLADRLVSTTNAGTTTTYAYDGDDRRVSSTVGGGGADLRAVWDPLAESGLPELALERTSGGSLIRRYLAGPLGAFSFTNSSATFSYHRDPLGTVTDVTDASGAAQWKYEYEAYGAERTATNVSGTAPENRLRFNSQYLDPETSHYHLRARQYDLATGRFGALDPVENPLSAPYDGGYVYVNSRPTVLVDPLGLYGWSDFKRDATSAADAVADFRAHAQFWSDQARRGAQRGGVLGNAQITVAWAADYAISPFADIQGGTETLWDPCASGWDKAKAVGSIGYGIYSSMPIGRGVRAGGAALGAPGLLGRNARVGGSRVNTDLPGGRSTAKSIFRNRTRGQRVVDRSLSNGGIRRRAQDGTQIRMNPDGSTRIDIQHPNGTRETIHFDP
jgi:RHS repeat-associated protein